MLTKGSSQRVLPSASPVEIVTAGLAFAGLEGEPEILILLPIPVRRQHRQAAKALLASRNAISAFLRSVMSSSVVSTHLLPSLSGCRCLCLMTQRVRPRWSEFLLQFERRAAAKQRLVLGAKHPRYSAGRQVGVGLAHDFLRRLAVEGRSWPNWR